MSVPTVHSRSIPAWAIVLTGIAALGVIAWHITAFPMSNPFYGLFENATDVRVYRAGADAVLDSRSLYDAPVLWRLHFTYPPFAALAFAPLAVLGADVAKITWWAIGFAALAAVVTLGARSLGYRTDARLVGFAVLFSVAVTALEPVRTTIWLGQVNLLIMALILTDLVFLRADSRWRGIAIGIAAGLKLTPLFAVIYLLVTRQWRAAATAITTFGATVAIGFLVIGADSRAYWTRHLMDSDRVGRADSPANQSVRGFGSQLLAHLDVRRFTHPGPGGPVFDVPPWLWVPAALVVAVLGLWAAVVARRMSRPLLAATIVGMTMCAVSPFAWGHHWVWCVPLLLVTLDLALRHGGSRRTWWYWLAPAGVVALTFTWWRHWWDSGPYLTSDHAISLGLFMMPRAVGPGPVDHALVLLYAGCYPLLLAVTVVATLLAGRRTRDRRPSVGESLAPEDVVAVA
ncbi:glycosyltransferase 87 family protein [Gordonia rubripertincta]|uniref:Glycosyltransferase 87 family protein n=2 Tax=Gordonia rubripertincta TaxID=36822 RepID=A0AAW6RCB7_GORRU|nr:glycosyltransferase 87 family protein [Gordonia rubripertincta]MDG6781326.1 glycosyltransferase 87 family protein [Gordonia rubripertincta]GAB85074.1 putative glycosyltransferase [Gordonia rubripertincta NBRC 101908]